MMPARGFAHTLVRDLGIMEPAAAFTAAHRAAGAMATQADLKKIGGAMATALL
jgi:hypothetical protein